MAPAAKRRKIEQPEALTFDPAARQEYLTGFHKRKLQRAQNAKDAAVKREKEEKVKERKQLREQRKEDLEKHVAEVNIELRKQNPDASDVESEAERGGDGAEWAGIDDNALEIAEDEEYVDEDKYTTVTVEPMGEPGDDSEDHEGLETAAKETQVPGGQKQIPKKRPWSKDGDKAKAKKKKFRYESKAERQATRQKQKSKNHAAKLRRTGK